MNSQFFSILIFILPIGLLIYFFVKKKKGNNENLKPKTKEEADEVWLTLKRFLRDKGEIGKEIIDSYVVKRADPYDRSTMTKEQRAEAKINDQKLKELKVSNPEEWKKETDFIKQDKKKKRPEIYVVLFTTKDTKTHEIDEPRAIECEVQFKKISKKEKERNIVINRVLDYDEEMLWISPIKQKDDEQFQKELDKKNKRQKSIEKRKQKELEKLNKA